MSDHFFIGYRRRMMPVQARFVKRLLMALGFGVLCAAGLFSYFQPRYSSGVFEYGQIKPFMGRLETKPYPHLTLASGQVVWLCAVGKFGLDQETLRDKQVVQGQGTLIYRSGQAMIEVQPGSLKPYSGLLSLDESLGSWKDLGEQVLTGEIVDLKCFLGVMKPGEFKPHRPCAVRCLSGGIPAILVVRWRDFKNEEKLGYFVLSDQKGKAIGKRLLDYVAEPVRVRGRVFRKGSLFMISTSVADVSRVKA